MAKSLRELLDEQKAAKAQAEKAPIVATPPAPNVSQPVPGSTAKPLFAGLNLLGTVPAETQKPVVAAESKPPAPISPVSSAEKTAVSADEFTHANQPVLMAADDAAQLKASLEFLVSSFPNPDQLRGAIVKIMTDLQERPHLVDMLYPDDIGTIVRALRESHQVAINVVEEKGSKKRKKAAEVDEFEKMLNGRGGITI